MLFFFKPKTIHLDCFTDRPEVYQTTPIVKGNACFPDWSKKMSKSEFDFNSMQDPLNIKNCMGFLEYHTESVCMRLWSDLAIRLNGHTKNCLFQFADKKSEIYFHPPSQYGDFLSEDYQHMKIITPWWFKCKEDIKWVYVGNSWSENLNNDMHIVPGILEYKYQHATQLQTVFKYVDGVVQDKMFKHNTPLINLFPMSERQVKIHNHLVDEKERAKLELSTSITFGNRYYSRKKVTKELEKTCPFK